MENNQPYKNTIQFTDSIHGYNFSLICLIYIYPYNILQEIMALGPYS